MAGVAQQFVSTNPFVDDIRREERDRNDFTFMRAGQRFGEGLLDSIISAYASVAHNSVACVLFVVLLYTFIAEHGANDGPLETLRDLCTTVEKNTTHTQPHRTLGTVCVRGTALLIKFKFRFITLGFLWFPWVVKPSRNNLIISAANSFLLFVLPKWQALDFVLLSQFHFLFSSLRNPTHKLLIFTVGAFVMYAVESFAESPSAKLIPKTGGGGTTTK